MLVTRISGALLLVTRKNKKTVARCESDSLRVARRAKDSAAFAFHATRYYQRKHSYSAVNKCQLLNSPINN